MSICIAKPKINLLCVALLGINISLQAMVRSREEIREEIEQRLGPLFRQLETAFEENNTNTMALLLPQIASISSPEETQVALNTTLHAALLADRYEMADLLIKHKADPNYSEDNGITLLMNIAMKGSAQAVDFLLKAGADPHPQGSVCSVLGPLRCNALFAGFFNDKDNLAITELLIKKINVNCLTDGRSTPLHVVACLPSRTRLTALLLEHHADPHARDVSNLKPLDLAFQKRATLGINNLYKMALLLYVYGSMGQSMLEMDTHMMREELDRYFAPAQSRCIIQECGRRQADLVCIRELCTPEQQQAQTFKESYRSALRQIVACFLAELPAALAPIIADYATYDPAIYFELCDEPEQEPEFKNDSFGKISKVSRKKKKRAAQKRCVIQ